MRLRAWPPALAALAAVMLSLAPAKVEAQSNLNVRPMRVEAEVPANRTARVNLRIANQHPTRTELLDLSVVDLTQDLDGTLQIVTEEMRAEMAPGRLRASSRDWVQLPAETVEVPPETTLELPVRLRVPADARGSFVSAVLLETQEPELPEGVEGERQAFFLIKFGFLVPLITGIENRPVRQNISIADVTMEFDDGTDESGTTVRNPTTRVAMRIANDGLAYHRLAGEVAVERRVGENWRTVTRGALPERAILPGVTLELSDDLERRLPPGEYRLLGYLSVDGRRLPRFDKVIAFEGDPSVDAVAYDTALELDPAAVSREIAPGAARTNVVRVTNPSDQPIRVSMAARTPASLEGVAMGETAGTEFSAAPWVQVQPAEFTLRPLGSRNVRLLARVPEEGLDQPFYYADIVLRGAYPDGQSAGETRSTLLLEQPSAQAAARATVERLTLAEAEAPSRYLVQARLVNTGNVHLEPVMEARLLDEAGDVRLTARLQGQEGWLLPLGVRDYGGALDLSELPPGAYTLQARARVGGEMLSELLPLEVSEAADGSRRVTLAEE